MAICSMQTRRGSAIRYARRRLSAIRTSGLGRSPSRRGPTPHDARSRSITTVFIAPNEASRRWTASPPDVQHNFAAEVVEPAKIVLEPLPIYGHPKTQSLRNCEWQRFGLISSHLYDHVTASPVQFQAPDLAEWLA